MSSGTQENEPRPPSPAEVYEASYVPALFEQWATIVADAARIRPGQHVVDVACGTGVLACVVAERVGAGGTVVGVDPSEDMLEVARSKNAGVEWRIGRAEVLSLPGATFDAVVSQFGLMFFEDRAKALREMMRVLRPGGRLVVAVCDALDHSPGYAVFAELLHRLFGESVAQAFRAPFLCGDRNELQALCAEAGVPAAVVARHDGSARFASIESLVSAERACAWTLGGALDGEQFDRLLKEAAESLRPFVAADGSVTFDMPALLVTALKA